MRRALLIAVLVFAAVPATASAKELDGFTMCGPGGCGTTELDGFGHVDPFAGTGAPSEPGAYYEVTLLMDDGAGSWRMFYVRETGLLAFEDGDVRTIRWMLPVPRLATALKRAARSLRPYPGPRITGVTVGARRVHEDPASYLALLDLPGAYADPGDGRAEAIVFDPVAPSPWTSEALWYYPETDVLAGAGRWVRLPGALAADVEAGRPLDASAGSWARPALLAAAAAVAATLLLALAVLVARRRSSRSATPVAARHVT